VGREEIIFTVAMNNRNITLVGETTQLNNELLMHEIAVVICTLLHYMNDKLILIWN
jgi:hypothetical protein